ncbi:MAG TPA: methylated-DNA--[protein]-cysteine S-methyltransferase, partial [Gammaproteobacteria bacterium]
AAPRRAWPLSRLHADPAGVARSVAELEAGRGGLLLRGSRFQLKVWEALLALPEGCVTSYGALAAALGRPRAARALGGALAANAVAVLIPCHRVLRAHGAPGGYRWGLERKLALLGREALRAGAGPPT